MLILITYFTHEDIQKWEFNEMVRKSTFNLFWILALVSCGQGGADHGEIETPSKITRDDNLPIIGIWESKPRMEISIEKYVEFPELGSFGPMPVLQSYLVRKEYTFDKDQVTLKVSCNFTKGDTSESVVEVVSPAFIAQGYFFIYEDQVKLSKKHPCRASLKKGKYFYGIEGKKLGFQMSEKEKQTILYQKQSTIN